jgi:S1-C subfamily serine protease
MYNDLADHAISNTDARLVEWLIYFIGLFGIDKVQYKAIVDGIVKARSLNEADAIVMRSGVFRFSEIMYYAVHNVLKEEVFSIPERFESSMLQKIYRHNISRDMSVHGTASFDYNVMLSDENIAAYVRLDCLDNTIRGTNYILSKYSYGLCHIEVENSEGEMYGGTGFIVRVSKQKHTYSFVITNKHVVDPAFWKINRILVPVGSISARKTWISSQHDLAAIEIEKTAAQASFNFSISSMHLQNVIAIGYPFVARVDRPVIMVHQGQINGFSDTIDGERLMFISASVSPGSSGGPVLNELGLVVGVTTQSNEGDYCVDVGGERKLFRSVHHAAIPADGVITFLDEIG